MKCYFTECDFKGVRVYDKIHEFGGFSFGNNMSFTGIFKENLSIILKKYSSSGDPPKYSLGFSYWR